MHISLDTKIFIFLYPWDLVIVICTARKTHKQTEVDAAMKASMAALIQISQYILRSTLKRRSQTLVEQRI